MQTKNPGHSEARSAVGIRVLKRERIAAEKEMRIAAEKEMRIAAEKENGLPRRRRTDCHVVGAADSSQ